MKIKYCSLVSMKVFVIQYTVKPVLRGHHWDKENWSFKTGNLLKEVQFI